jgi:transposase-like protein
VQDILIAVEDGLNGFPDAINASFPRTQVQTCIVIYCVFVVVFCMEGSP